MAVGVYEMVVLIVVAAAVGSQRLSTQGLAGGGEPLFPFVGGLWFVIGVQQVVPAQWATAVLGLEQPQRGLVQQRGFAFATPQPPVFGQGGVVRGLDRPRSFRNECLPT